MAHIGIVTKTVTAGQMQEAVSAMTHAFDWLMHIRATHPKIFADHRPEGFAVTDLHAAMVALSTSLEG